MMSKQQMRFDTSQLQDKSPCKQQDDSLLSKMVVEDIETHPEKDVAHMLLYAADTMNTPDALRDVTGTMTSATEIRPVEKPLQDALGALSEAMKEKRDAATAEKLDMGNQTSEDLERHPEESRSEAGTKVLVTTRYRWHHYLSAGFAGFFIGASLIITGRAIYGLNSVGIFPIFRLLTPK